MDSYYGLKGSHKGSYKASTELRIQGLGVIIIGVMSRVTMMLTHMRGLITLLNNYKCTVYMNSQVG